MFSDAEIAVFMEELDEKIQIISDNLLLMEKEGDSPEVLQEIFRAAHTIKGSSAVMGYDKMSALTHEIENLFDQLRRGTLQVTPALTDILFEALDTLRALRAEITGGGEEVDTKPVVAKIRKFQEGAEVPAVQAGGQESPAARSPAQPGEISTDDIQLPPLEDVEESLIREAELKGYRAYWITVLLSSDCQMKEVRAFLIFETLQQTGEIIKSSPPAEEIQEGQFDRHFTVILLTTEDADRIRNLAFSVAEVEDVYVKQVEINGKQVSDKNVKNNGAPDAGQRGKAPTSIGDKKPPSAKTVRVDVRKLDALMNLVGELVIDRTRLERFVEIFESQYGSSDLAEEIMEISSHLGQVTTDLQDEIMKARMLPISYVFNRLPRMVRDIAHKMHKKVDFIVEGRETELDRNVIEVISDPLIHLLRNAIDHGIEPPEERERLGKPRTGTIKLKASYVESHIVITLEDDGRGIDASKIRQKIVDKGLVTPDQAERLSDREVLDYIFTPGFSTAENINDISGRGVGMDIVKNHIEQINGTVEFSTVPGRGTTFTIKLPLTLAIIRTLMVTLGKHTYAIPLTHIVEILAIKRDEIKMIRRSKVVVVRSSVLPLVRLSDIFNQQSTAGEEDKIYVVVLGSGDKKVGVIVDRLLGEQEIVIKSLGPYLGQIDGLSGATILGDGRVALIVDARGIINKLGTSPEDTAYAAAN